MSEASNRQSDRLTPELVARIDEKITHYPVSKRSASVPLLHLWQNHFGYIDDSGVVWIAEKLGLQPVEIEGLVTFYPWFRQNAPGKTTVRLCRTLACAMAGSYDLREALCRSAGIDPHQAEHGHGATSPDGRFTIEFVECLACCGSAPVCMVGDTLHENVKEADIPALLGK